MKHFNYSLDVLHDLTGTYFSIFVKKFLITTYDDYPIIIYLNYKDKYQNKLQCSEGFYSSKDKYEEKVDYFRKISHIAWLDEIPFLLAEVKHGVKLRCDAILEQKIGYQSILIWTGRKPKSCPVLNVNEILFVQQYAHLPIRNIVFKEECSFVYVEIDNYVRQLPFSCDGVFLNGVLVKSNEELKKVYSSLLPKKLAANVSKFINLDDQYLYICNSVSLEHFNDKITTKSEICCRKVYKNNSFDLMLVENCWIIYFDVEFELIYDKNMVHFVVDGININLRCDIEVTESSFGTAHILYIGNYWHLLVIEVKTKEQNNCFPSIITLVQCETFVLDSCHSKNVYKLVNSLGFIVDANSYMNFLSAKGVSTSELTNSNIQIESELSQSLASKDDHCSIRSEHLDFFITKKFITNIEEHCLKLKTVANDFSLNKQESLNSTTENLKSEVNGNYSYFKETEDDKETTNINRETNINIINQECLDSKIKFEINDTVVTVILIFLLYCYFVNYILVPVEEFLSNTFERILNILTYIWFLVKCKLL